MTSLEDESRSALARSFPYMQRKKPTLNSRESPQLRAVLGTNWAHDGKCLFDLACSQWRPCCKQAERGAEALTSLRTAELSRCPRTLCLKRGDRTRPFWSVPRRPDGGPLARTTMRQTVPSKATAAAPRSLAGSSARPLLHAIRTCAGTRPEHDRHNSAAAASMGKEASSKETSTTDTWIPWAARGI